MTFVKAAQAAGLTLAEIRDVVAAHESNGPLCQHLAGLLDVYAAEFAGRIERLRPLRAEVQRLRERAATLPSA